MKMSIIRSSYCICVKQGLKLHLSMHCQDKHLQNAYILHNETIAEWLDTDIMQALPEHAVQSAYMLDNEAIAEWLDAQLGQQSSF